MLKISENIRCIGDEYGGAILDIDQGLIFRVNSSGSLILNCLKAGISEDGIVKQVASQYGIPEKQAQADVDGFLLLLQARGLVRCRSERKG